MMASDERQKDSDPRTHTHIHTPADMVRKYPADLASHKRGLETNRSEKRHSDRERWKPAKR